MDGWTKLAIEKCFHEFGHVYYHTEIEKMPLYLGNLQALTHLPHLQ